MEIIKNSVAFFSRPKDGTFGGTPEGLCPNCWGKQEYDNMVRELYQDKRINVRNHEANYAFIQEFVVRHIDVIQLKKDNNGYECTTCHSRYPSS